MRIQTLTNNETIKVSFPGRWLAILSIPIFTAMGLTVQSSWSQSDTFERAILVHAQEKHKDSASAKDLYRVEFTQNKLGEDVLELQIIVKDLINEIKELMIILRANNLDYKRNMQ